jgi:hypothetical protein
VLTSAPFLSTRNGPRPCGSPTPELQPEAHDAQDLAPHVGVRRVEVGLEVVEAVEVVLAAPRSRVHVALLHAGKTMPRSSWRGRFFDHTYQSRYGDCGSLRAAGTTDADRGVIDDQIDDHAHAELLGVFMNSTNSPSVPCLGWTP